MMYGRAFVGALLVAGFLGCQGRLLNIRVTDEASTIIGRGTLVERLVADLGFEDFTGLDVTASEELQNQGVRPGDISDVYLTLFELEATSPEGADLSFLDALDVYVESPGLPRVLIASADAFPEGEPLVAMDLGEVDLVDYVVSRSMTLSTEARGRRPQEDVTVTARYALRVGVTGQGACNHIRGDD